MDSCLGGESAFADVRRVTIGCAVKPFIERVRNMSEFFKRGRANSDIESRCKFRLKF